MQVLKVNPRKIEYNKVNQVVKVLKHGGTVVYPTDTAYGLGGDFFSSQARERIYTIKGRSSKKVLPAIVASPLMAKRIVKFDKISWQLAKKYWPGPLTLVLPVKKEYLKLVQAKTIALRVPDSQIAVLLSQKLRSPLVSTSANVSGTRVCYSVVSVVEQFANKDIQPDLILDAGTLPQVEPSTIVQVVKGKVNVLREGPVKIK